MDYFIYGHSIRGKSHIRKNIVCQDAHKYIELGNGWVVAAVADGVGVAEKADIGSKIAVEIAVAFAADNMPLSYRENGIKRAIYLAFNAALKKIIQKADADNESLEKYDTTLSLVVFNGVCLYYGHSGDGGIFGLTVYGDYVEITTPHKGSDGLSVIPLRMGEDTWTIDAYREELTSVLLVTDGVRDAIKPFTLGNGEKDVYVPICSLLMHPSWFHNHLVDYKEITQLFLGNQLNKNVQYQLLTEVYQNAILEQLMVPQAVQSVANTDYISKFIQRVDDDITALAVINASTNSAPAQKTSIYYSEPNWKTKEEQLSQILYAASPSSTTPSSKHFSTMVLPIAPTLPIQPKYDPLTPQINPTPPRQVKPYNPTPVRKSLQPAAIVSALLVLVLVIIGATVVVKSVFGLFSHDELTAGNTPTEFVGYPTVNNISQTSAALQPTATEYIASLTINNQSQAIATLLPTTTVFAAPSTPDNQSQASASPAQTLTPVSTMIISSPTVSSVNGLQPKATNHGY